MPVLTPTHKSAAAAGRRGLALAVVRALALALAACCGALGLSGGPARAQAADCGDVALAEFAWPAARLATAALARLLEDGQGCRVERLSATPDRVTAAIGEFSDAGRAVAATGVDPETLGADLRVRPGAPTFVGARQGFFVLEWFQQANPDIETLADAVRAAARFSGLRGGRPQIWICPAHWRCHAESLATLEALGVGEAFEIVAPASGEALIQALIAADDARRPWIGYFWTPSATAAEHPLSALSIGALRICAPPADGGAEPICREPFAEPAAISVYSAAFDRRAPEAAALIRRFSAPADAAMDALAWRARTNASIDQTADFMLARRPELWRALLGEAERRAFESALSARMAAAPD